MIKEESQQIKCLSSETRVQNLVSILICQLIQLSELRMTRFLQALVSYFETEDIV